MPKGSGSRGAVVAGLGRAVLAAVLGDWAADVHGIIAPWSHHDIDLVLFDPELSILDSFVAERDEITSERLPRYN